MVAPGFRFLCFACWVTNGDPDAFYHKMKRQKQYYDAEYIKTISLEELREEEERQEHKDDNEEDIPF